jgi:hypothetical protein
VAPKDGDIAPRRTLPASAVGAWDEVENIADMGFTSQTSKFSVSAE